MKEKQGERSGLLKRVIKTPKFFLTGRNTEPGGANTFLPVGNRWMSGERNSIAYFLWIFP